MATAHLEACKSPLNVSNENKNKDVIENISRESNRIETVLISPDKIRHQGALETLKGDSVGGEATAEANQEKFANVINVKNGGNRSNNINNSDNGNKFSFRTPQQFLQRKMWNKHFKSRKYHQKSYQQINKADMENVQNIKNQVSNQRKQQQANKNIKKVYNRKMISQRAAQFSVRSKFFLPDKRPRKEIIIPPTKFLLGGNISDPLNLNSLQDEALNATPTPTPKQSPITTPPKVEVIIPPNIHDPLHLLDPVDTVEYEKQLVSPMKRKSKSKHRNRKKKPKRKKRLQNSSSSEVIPVPAVSASNTATAAANSSQASASVATVNGSKSFDANLAVGEDGAESIASGGDKLATCAVPEEEEAGVMNQNNKSVGSLIVNTSTCGGSAAKEPQQDSAQKLHSTNSLAVRRSIDREKVTRDLRLDLGPILEHQQQCQQPHSAGGNGGGRKRKSSEGPNSNKNKFRRLDAMDKIVSPVVPQPGAWKRPPRLVPTGARKVSRHRSTSVSETDLISPTEELKPIESESIQGDTPDVEAAKPAEIPPENHPPVFPKLPKFKPEEAKYQYGNYDRYAGYRNLNEFTDVRLQVFQRNPNLFRGKDVLDVGCNVGHITIAVGKNLAPKSILGLDIDSKLIIRARRNLSMYVRIPKNEPEEKNIKEVKKEQATTSEPAKSENSNSEVEVKKEAKPPLFLKGTKIKGIHHHSKRRFSHKPKYELERTEFFPVSFPISYGGIPSTVSKKPDKEESSPSRPKSPDNPHFENEFPKNVFFKTANYVLSDETMLNNDTQQYDLILCLSVTKWIHLNFGDSGLKMAFKRMFNQLRPGGKLILEAQNWASYKKKKNLTETIYENYRSIEFFPNKFHEYLLSNEVGFSHSYTLGVPRHLSKGFCRPIQLYAKGDFTPNHIRWSDNYHPQTPYEAYRGIYASMPPPPYPIWSYDTPQDYHGSYSCLQTPMHQPTSQYYNPLETDSYLPSYDTEIVHGHYVFASPLYQTVWSPPASLRNSSTHTPVFGSVRDCDLEDGSATTKHVYPPNDESSSPRVSNGAFNSIREADSEDCSQESQRKHVYANCENSSSPRDDVVDESPEASQSQEGAADIEENSADKGDNNGGTLGDHDDG